MNILPKKKWHVRTKDNIERVRRDEAQAAEEAREVERRALLAEQEARTSLLRARARERLGHSNEEELKTLEEPKEDEEALIGPSLSDIVPGGDGGVISSSGHVNFFQDLEEGQNSMKGNEEHEEEKKKEQEEYEKKVGYLTYLGQDTEELTGDQVWWKKLPSNRKEIVTEEQGKSSVGTKQKDFLDPLKDLRRHLGCDGVQLTLKKYEKKIERTEQKALGIERSGHTKRETSKKKKRRRDSSSEDSEYRRSKKRKRESSVEDKKLSKKKRRKRSRSPSKSHKSRKQKKSKHRKKSKRKSSSSESSSSDSDSDREVKVKQKANLEKLRQERLARERTEKERTHKLLYGEPVKEEKPVEKVPEKVQKYNSQFNPDVAKQNKLDPNRKYWLD